MGWLARLGGLARREARPLADDLVQGRNSMLSASEAVRLPDAATDWARGHRVFEATHATSADFDAFDPTKVGLSDPGWRGRGHYFTPLDAERKAQLSAPHSKGFAYGQVERDGSLKEGARNVPVLIRMKKPFTDAEADNAQVAAAFERAGYKGISRDYATGKPLGVLKPGLRSDFDLQGGRNGPDEVKARMAKDAADFTAAAQKLGYDGAKWEGELVVFPGNEANIRSKFAKFDPAQSRSSNLLAAIPAAVGGGLLSRWAMQPEDYQV